MASNTKQIASTEWERHKEVIISLRRSGIVLEGGDGIIATMKKNHGFIARYAIAIILLLHHSDFKSV